MHGRRHRARSAGMLLPSALVLALLLGACGGDDGSDAVDGLACDMLTPEQLETLAGEPLGDPRTVEVTSLPTCEWGSSVVTGVQVIDVTATEWASHVGDAIDQAERSGAFDDPANADKLQRARDLLASEAGDDQVGCEIFSLLLEVQGEPAGRTRATQVLPSADNPEGITAQACEEGRFASVLLRRTDLGPTREEVERVTAALDEVLAAGSPAAE